MNSIKFYSDQAAFIAHQRVKAELQHMVDALFPNLELSHIGINRNDMTEAVEIRLHLNPIGSVRVVPGGGDGPARLGGPT